MSERESFSNKTSTESKQSEASRCNEAPPSRPDNPDKLAIEVEHQSGLQSLLDSMRNFAGISSLMRLIGALTLMAGMSVFLLQGWGPGNDSSRFLIMLTQTLLMFVTGFGLHFLLKENKGARLFFGLSLVSVTANFAVLGALIYSLVQFDSLAQGLPGYATWVTPDLPTLALCALAGVVVLLPVSFFSFGLFARGNSKRFTGIYLAAGAMLLIPVRDPAIVVALIFAALFVVSRRLKSIQGTNTRERKLAQGALFAPLMVMAFRSLYFYQIEALAILIILSLMYYGSRLLTQRCSAESNIKIITNLVSLPLASWISLCFFDVLYGYIDGPYIDNHSAMVFLTTVLFAALMVDLFLRSREKPYARLFSVAGSLALALGLFLVLMLENSGLLTLLTIATASIWAVSGYSVQSRIMTISGTLLAGLILVTEFVDLIRSIDLNNWLLLSIVGASTIVIASVIDRHGLTLKLKFIRLMQSSSRLKQQKPG